MFTGFFLHSSFWHSPRHYDDEYFLYRSTKLKNLNLHTCSSWFNFRFSTHVGDQLDYDIVNVDNYNAYFSFSKKRSGYSGKIFTVETRYNEIAGTEKFCLLCQIFCYTGRPRKNATTLIVNFMNIVDETKLFFCFGRILIFQQNDTMIISKVSGL